VSNFDTRLRPLLRALNCDDWFDAVAVSAEVCKLVFFFSHFVLSADAYNLLIEVIDNAIISSLPKNLWDGNSGNKS
jgi:hypothetical protein